MPYLKIENKIISYKIMTDHITSYCGYIALVGRPNVGKSTLLNKLLNQKVSITSRKPQTTRHKILGIHTLLNKQFIFVDTPGIHQRFKKKINKIMNQTAVNVLHDVDLIVFIVEALQWRSDDEFILKKIEKVNVPCYLVINKIDKIKKDELFPWVEKISALYKFQDIIPLSAKTGYQVPILEKELDKQLPEGPHLFSDEEFTDRPIRFLCAEILREKIFRLCGDELPYSVTIEIESFKEEKSLVKIHALILVEKQSHKRMIIGAQGLKLKQIATDARIDMEALLGKKVFLQCFCKVKSGWADNERALKSLGYDH